MRILVCGGTGFIGRHIVDSLKQAGHEPCSAAARRPAGFFQGAHGRGLAAASGRHRRRDQRRGRAARQRRPAAASHACRRPHRAVRRLRGGGRAAGGADLGPGHRAQRHALRQHQARRRRASAGADGAGAVERLRAASQRGVRRRRRQQPAVPGPGAPAGLLLPRAVLQARVQPVAVRDRPTRWRAWRVRMRRRAWSRSADPRPCRWRS